MDHFATLQDSDLVDQALPYLPLGDPSATIPFAARGAPNMMGGPTGVPVNEEHYTCHSQDQHACRM
ncbi:hypothetical protein HDZ31DRAFT_67733 [Schizophyllum fasciatum]